MIDPQALTKKVNVKYPYFLATDADMSFNLMLRNLEEGDMTLCLKHDGTVYVTKKISRSAYNVEKLLRICKLSMVTEQGTVKLENVQEYLMVV